MIFASWEHSHRLFMLRMQLSRKKMRFDSARFPSQQFSNQVKILHQWLDLLWQAERSYPPGTYQRWKTLALSSRNKAGAGSWDTNSMWQTQPTPSLPFFVLQLFSPKTCYPHLLTQHCFNFEVPTQGSWFVGRVKNSTDSIYSYIHLQSITSFKALFIISFCYMTISNMYFHYYLIFFPLLFISTIIKLLYPTSPTLPDT